MKKLNTESNNNNAYLNNNVTLCTCVKCATCALCVVLIPALTGVAIFVTDLTQTNVSQQQ